MYQLIVNYCFCGVMVIGWFEESQFMMLDDILCIVRVVKQMVINQFQGVDGVWVYLEDELCYLMKVLQFVV